MRAALHGLPTALVMLTRVPVRRQAHFDPVTAGPWFPVVGASTGAAVAGVLLATGAVLPAAAAALLAVTFEVVLTGALHLDGLADTADSVGGHDREERLAIMRDHSVGVFGAAAVVLSLGLRGACLASLLLLPLQTGVVVAVTTAAWTISRTAMLLPAVTLRYARESGTGQGFVSGLTWRVAGVGIMAGALLVCVTSLFVDGTVWRSLAAGVVGTLMATTFLTSWAAARLGGVTGDVLGAVAEAGLVAGLLAETAALNSLQP